MIYEYFFVKMYFIGSICVCLYILFSDSTDFEIALHFCSYIHIIKAHFLLIFWLNSQIVFPAVVSFYVPQKLFFVYIFFINDTLLDIPLPACFHSFIEN